MKWSIDYQNSQLKEAMNDTNQALNHCMTAYPYRDKEAIRKTLYACVDKALEQKPITAFGRRVHEL